MQTLTHLWNAYISNVLDIVILAIIFYQIILFLKGTRAIQIIVGIAVLIVVAFIAKNVLHLKAFSWVVDKFWFGAVIIFAIVFQNEIRNFLAQIGTRISSGLNKIEDSYATEITAAAIDLSRMRAGALMVLEHDIGLKNITSTGVKLNANISRELLLSIFANKSAPLHDGAAVIYNEKISAAGCMLPLSNDTDIRMFGTRHRAALGLSEITDAMIIVVSEETGHISIAYKGKIHWNIHHENLKQSILETKIYE
jgi:diadenylate cyclase